jgi:hypothetical protein
MRMRGGDVTDETPITVTDETHTTVTDVASDSSISGNEQQPGMAKKAKDAATNAFGTIKNLGSSFKNWLGFGGKKSRKHRKSRKNHRKTRKNRKH